MKILVDADACPTAIKEVIFRASKRLAIDCTLFANHPMAIPNAKTIHFIQVGQGFDVADNVIVSKVEPKDLVITADIPLAKEVIDKGATALNPRGQLYTKDNIQEKLNLRDFAQQLRDAGQMGGGPAALSKRDVQQFANALDSFLAKHR